MACAHSNCTGSNRIVLVTTACVDLRRALDSARDRKKNDGTAKLLDELCVHKRENERVYGHNTGLVRPELSLDKHTSRTHMYCSTSRTLSNARPSGDDLRLFTTTLS